MLNYYRTWIELEDQKPFYISWQKLKWEKNICLQMENYSSKIRNKHYQRVSKQHIVFHNKWQNISHYLFCHDRKNIFSLLQPMHSLRVRDSGCLSQDNVLSSQTWTFSLFSVTCQYYCSAENGELLEQENQEELWQGLSAIRRGKRPALYLNPNPIKGRPYHHDVEDLNAARNALVCLSKLYLNSLLSWIE